MSSHSLVIRSPAAMRRLGLELGHRLRPGDFIGLVGDLGAGKTVLVRGIAEGDEVPAGEVASPTFAIVYPYRGRVPLHHADLYRVGDEEELFATGFYDLIGGEAAVVVEWIDRVPEALPPEHLTLRIARTDERTRRVDLEPTGERYEQLARELVEAVRPARRRRAAPDFPRES